MHVFDRIVGLIDRAFGRRSYTLTEGSTRWTFFDRGTAEDWFRDLNAAGEQIDPAIRIEPGPWVPYSRCPDSIYGYARADECGDARS